MRNKSIFLSIIVLTIVLTGISVIGINQSFAQTDVEIPPWVKGVANFWVEDKIDDGEFAEALEFLIDSDIIQLGNTEYRGMSEIEQKCKAKLDEQEKRHTAAMFSDSQQWGKLSEEYDQKLVDERKRYDDMVELKSQEHKDEIKEWQETYNKQQEEITDLKSKMKN